MAYSVRDLTENQYNDFNIGVMLSLCYLFWWWYWLPDFALFVTLTEAYQKCQRIVHYSGPVCLFFILFIHQYLLHALRQVSKQPEFDYQRHWDLENSKFGNHLPKNDMKENDVKWGLKVVMCCKDLHQSLGLEEQNSLAEPLQN